MPAVLLVTVAINQIVVLKKERKLHRNMMYRVLSMFCQHGQAW